MVPASGACWWCGDTLPGLGALVTKSISDTFQGHELATLPASPWLCAGCAWSISSAVRLPPELADASLGKRLDAGGRAKISIDGAPPERRLVLRLASGRIGLWSTASRNAGEEDEWDAARDELRVSPRDAGLCVYLGDVGPGQLGTGTAQWRNYHHFGTASRWAPVPNSTEGKAQIRAWLLDPPDEPHATVIGDGQKHIGLLTPLSGRPLCTVCLIGEVIHYAPADLARWLASYETLIRLGAGDDEIASGDYRPRTVDLALAVRLHDPILAPLRGGPRMSLCAFLRRPRKELTDAA